MDMLLEVYDDDNDNEPHPFGRNVRSWPSGGFTLRPGAQPLPQIVARPPNLVVLLTHSGELIPGNFF